MDNGVRAITKMVNAMDSVRKLMESAQALARQTVGLSASDTSRDVYGTQAAEMMNQAAKILNDSGFGGSGLLQTNATVPTDLTIVTNIATTAAGRRPSSSSRWTCDSTRHPALAARAPRTKRSRPVPMAWS